MAFAQKHSNPEIQHGLHCRCPLAGNPINITGSTINHFHPEIVFHEIQSIPTLRSVTTVSMSVQHVPRNATTILRLILSMPTKPCAPVESLSKTSSTIMFGNLEHSSHDQFCRQPASSQLGNNLAVEFHSCSCLLCGQRIDDGLHGYLLAVFGDH